MLNDWNEKTKDNIHIMVTSLCDRNCPHCCNKQYDLATIPYVSEEELRAAKRIFITGGEPFTFSDPCNIAQYYKSKYSNIESVIVYANALELAKYLWAEKEVYGIDGVTVSIKNTDDLECFALCVNKDKRITDLPHNRLYVFGRLMPRTVTGFAVFKREWQSDFKPAPDSIFRRV